MTYNTIISLIYLLSTIFVYYLLIILKSREYVSLNND